MRAFATVCLVGLLACAGSGKAEAANGTRPTIVALGTTLVDATNNVLGVAGFQSVTRNGATKTSFEAALWNLNLPAGTTLNVVVNGAQVATATVKTRGSRGKAAVILLSARGDAVPAVTAGQTISVETTAGVVVASGTFQKFR